MSEQTFDSVYCDGGVCGSNPSPIGGTWAICYVKDGELVRERSGFVSSEHFDNELCSNNNTELYALCKAIMNLPHGWTGTVYCDSNVSLLRVFRGGKLNGVPDWLAERVGIVRAQLKHLNLKHVLLDGHPTKAQLASGIGKRGNPVSKWNARCDELCNLAKDKAKKPEYKEPGDVGG